MVDRYKLGHCVCGSQLEKSAGGGLVLHVDYKALEAECERLREELAEAHMEIAWRICAEEAT